MQDSVYHCRKKRRMPSLRNNKSKEETTEQLHQIIKILIKDIETYKSHICWVYISNRQRNTIFFNSHKTCTKIEHVVGLFPNSIPYSMWVLYTRGQRFGDYSLTPTSILIWGSKFLLPSGDVQITFSICNMIPKDLGSRCLTIKKSSINFRPHAVTTM